LCVNRFVKLAFWIGRDLKSMYRMKLVML
jgi:hypothetical protein